MVTELFTQRGVPVPTGNHRPVALSDPDALWWVESGLMDVFAVPMSGGQPAGLRTHLLRVEAGEVILSLQHATDGAAVRFVAVGAVETRVRQLDRTALETTLADSSARQQWASLVDTWIRGLLAGLTKHLPPTRFTSLTPGRETTLPVGQLGCALDAVVWAQLRQGSARVAGLPELLLAAGPRWIPVTPASWLEAVEDVTAVVSDTQTLLGAGHLAAALDDCGALIAQWVALNQQRFAQRETLRIQAKEADKQRGLATAIRGLGSLLGDVDRQVGAPAEEADPLLAACRLLGPALGIEWQSPPKARASSVRDPLLQLAEVSRTRLRRVVLAGNWWEQDNGPMLGYLERDGRPVALLPVGTRTYELRDPADGTRTRITHEVAEQLKPTACGFFRSFPDRALQSGDLLRFALRGVWPDLITICLVGIAGALLGLLTPIATGIVFDSIIPSAQRPQLLQMTLGLFVAALGGLTFEITRAVALLRAESRTNATIEAAIWDRLLLLPVGFFRQYSAGDLAMRANGVNIIRQHLSQVVLGSVLSGVFSLFNLALLYYYSVTLALVATALVAISVLITGASSLLNLRYTRQYLEVQGKISGLVVQLITGISKLRVAGAEPQAYAQWACAFAREKRFHLRSQFVANLFAVFNAVVPSLASICLFATIAFYLKEQIPTGAFMAFNAAWGSFLAAMLGMTSSLMSALEIFPLYKRTRPILETAPEIDRSKTDPGVLSGRIEFSHVVFRYTEDTPPVLNDVSFDIEPGQFIAVVGPSGSGKSTVFRLLLGFEAPESGALFFDGVDLAGLDVAAVRKQMGVVLQNGKLIPGTIFDNIVGASTLTLDDAWDAARKAGLAEDIERMPMGMHTVLSEGAGTISGGQRQRLMIARAIVSRPRIVLFDEATSALDNPTQAMVSQSLEQLQATRVVIAHRLSTIVHAHRILVLHHGKLVQQGDYATLIGQPGLFADLAKRQLV